MTDDKRVVYCMKKWIKEIQEIEGTERLEVKRAIHWIVSTWENEIHDGTYCEDEEYNEYLITGVI